MEWIPLASAAVTAVLSFLGVYISNRKQTAVMSYRLNELEKKVDKHNQVIERTYKLEERATVLEKEVDDLRQKAG